MLLSLSVDNFRSFKNGFEFSMEATKLKNLKESNVAKVENIELLYSSILYGANASGKSNYIKSFAKMKAILKNSTSIEKAKQYPHEPFMLNTHTKNLPTRYEIEIILYKTKYRYGFEIAKDAKIQKEWLFYKNLKPYAQEVKLFDRIDKNIEVYSHYKDTKVLESKTRDEALFLVVTAEFNSEISKMIYDWFDKIQVISNIDTKHLETYSFEKLNDELYRDKIINIIKNADVGISDIISKKLTLDEIEGKLKLPKEVIESFPKDIRENIKANGITKIDTVHMIYDEKDEFQGYEEFDLEFESDGTKKLLALSAPLVESLIQGNTIFIDELDNSLHLDLIEAIIKLYHDKDINQNNAQIIFSTHNTNLLNQEIFRRDQIWFVEKDIYGSSQLYSLVEYGKGKARDDLALEKNYNAGKFGAKPSIGLLW
ncbi:ATP-binding protein [bacterium]|nr:ATP-binding protein [bacterium]